jgi:hypothetical protein
LIHESEEGQVSRTPAVHGSFANLAASIASLLERQMSHRQLIFSRVIGTLELCHDSHHLGRIDNALVHHVDVFTALGVEP